MDYIELACKIDSNQFEIAREILIGELASIGFESFVETDSGILAYIINRDFEPIALKNLNIVNRNVGKFSFKWDLIKDQNWNQEWENNFSPVLINNQCYVRATFHKPIPDIKYEIVIDPKMSFGTGHHETTSLMIENMLEATFKNNKVLDMGCGTGILAILASKLGASEIIAIDIDEWAYHNTKENISLNNAQNIKVILGGKDQIPIKEFDFVLANINRNILLNDMDVYVKVLKQGGYILFSGIYESDHEIIHQKANQCKLNYKFKNSKNNWISILYQKN